MADVSTAGLIRWKLQKVVADKQAAHGSPMIDAWERTCDIHFGADLSPLVHLEKLHRSFSRLKWQVSRSKHLDSEMRQLSLEIISTLEKPFRLSAMSGRLLDHQNSLSKENLSHLGFLSAALLHDFPVVRTPPEVIEELRDSASALLARVNTEMEDNDDRATLEESLRAILSLLSRPEEIVVSEAEEAAGTLMARSLQVIKFNPGAAIASLARDAANLAARLVTVGYKADQVGHDILQYVNDAANLIPPAT